jgi:hypothetical protein
MKLRSYIIGAGQLMCPAFIPLLQPFFHPAIYFPLPALAEDQKLAQGDTMFVPSPIPS